VEQQRGHLFHMRTCGHAAWRTERCGCGSFRALVVLLAGISSLVACRGRVTSVSFANLTAMSDSDGAAETLLIRLPPVYKRALRRWAQASGTSMSNVVRVAIRAGMTRESPDGLPIGWNFEHAPTVTDEEVSVTRRSRTRN
jgi:hypothetical protein